MPFINTRDTIGDTATVDGLVEHSLTDLLDDSVYTVADYGCYYNTGLQTVNLPNVTSIGSCAFYGCSNLETVILGDENNSSLLQLGTECFRYCSKLTHLILNCSEPPNINNNTFYNTPLSRKYGAVYVPTDLVSTYKSNTYWSSFVIYDKSRYPATVFETITDSWATILADTNPAEHYKVGDIKTISFSNDNPVTCQILAFSSDSISSDQTKFASITWRTRSVWPEAKKMNDTQTTLGGWENSILRAWLISDVLPLLEATEIGPSLQTVIKTYRTKHSRDGDATKSCNDKIWLLSAKEVGASQSAGAESVGLRYAGLSISTNELNLQTSEGTNAAWWLRSAYNAYSFAIQDGTSTSSSSANNNRYVSFGFCTGISTLDTISDSWATILADTNPAEHYNVGDTKTLFLSDQNVIICQIAAFDTDVLASDSSKTARITWIMKHPYYTQKQLTGGTNAGGWEATYLRTWLISDVLPLLEASEVGSSLQTVTKTFRTKHSDDGDTTKSCSDKIWIPSYREVGLTSSALVESSGVTYPLLFPSGTTTAAKNARMRNPLADNAQPYWLRTIRQTQYDRWCTIDNTGADYYATGTSTCGIIFGFCTGVSS